ncbi:N-acetylglucosamine kinase-like BadF-type ATPase [Murinocardiopsis flavida]|uniref:N-acetylglucosamine kinase-like BadF-type ATPase n=1 Tax=Murinocardiopsis flavida TaxID=645275 RepID=A0A2P8D544_9ACTN|nr:N-acetylglucosamine kinase-like BadF-type ATPase [Murinocardiopsis flavida]
MVIGVDAGGTSTRCVVAALDGRVLSRGRAGGANQNSSADPSAAFAEVLRAALAPAGDVRVVGAVFGVAGASEAGREHAEATVGRAWRAQELPGTPVVRDDITVAFAAGTAQRTGSVLIAGTGAAAALVDDGEVVRRCDGYGWLLGDEGSAVWLGLAGLRAVMAGIDGRGPATALTTALAAELGIAPGDNQLIIRAVYAMHPAELGRLAPEVARAATAGDGVAASIVAQAAGLLLRNLGAVRAGAPAGAPVVLAGSLLAGGPVADAVREGLRGEGVRPGFGADGAVGAAGLALRAVGAPESGYAALLARAQ